MRLAEIYGDPSFDVYTEWLPVAFRAGLGVAHLELGSPLGFQAVGQDIVPVVQEDGAC